MEPAPTPAKAPEPSSPPPQPTGWVKPITEHEIHPRKKPALTAKEALAQKARERAGKHPRKAAKPHRHTDAQQPEAQEGTAEPRGVAKPAEAARGTTKPREGLAALRRKGRRPAPTQTETALAPPPKPTLWQRILRFFGIGGK